MIVVCLPLIVQLIVDEDLVRPALSNSSLLTIDFNDLAILCAAGLAGAFVSERLHIPGGIMIVPMLFTAALELSGVTSAKPPGELVIIAQIVLGAGIGGRCIGVELKEIGDAVKHASSYVLIMLTLTALSAWLLLELGNIAFWPGMLSFAPGGLAEMSLIALALGLNVGFIATIHTVRILIVVLAGPVAFKLLRSHLE